MERISEWWEQLAWKWKGSLVGIGVLIGLLCLGIFWWSNQTATPDPTMKVTQAATTAPKEKATAKPVKAKPTGNVVVDVKGAVKHPGVYQMEPDTRIDKIIQLAGGFLESADVNQVNLAQKATDQTILYVPNQGEKPPVGPSNATAGPATAGNTATPAGSGSSTGKINLNQADATQLQSISGVGAKKAEKIIAYRQQTGSFKAVDDLKNVPGFGVKTVTQLQDSLTV
ncbi:ComEA family DNA-binding protein [Fructilactobacillus carniphilus]|uniref:ComEA family DNA-binding protein n=1 Tax=Fructilactobacillus carniphilus TaxID=2940297 RepID=A0ABY5BZA8_9LACO|nr:ComEA family DNA-binding protein [Fructilactobacillus carniphilus]USS90928.1 ComEA family DNA-binding protein [Fructilactobacillus carniphilus]